MGTGAFALGGQETVGASAAEPERAAPAAVAPPPHHPRFPLLDGMRAIAVLSVLLVHVAFFAAPGSVPAARALAHLNLGVTIFFLISGFLLYRPFVAHRAGGAPAPAIRDYARRRALRIFPAYWLALTVLSILPGTIGVGGGEWLSQYTLTHTLPLTDNAGSCALTVDCGLSQTWSLAVELSFYLTLPLWYLLAERIARARLAVPWVRTELGILAALSALSVAVHFGLSGGGIRSVVGGTVVGFVLWFALGMALAIGSVAIEGGSRPRWLEAVRGRPGGTWLAAAGVYALLCAWLPPTPFVLDTSQQLWAYLGFGLVSLLLMLPAVFADEAGGAPRRLLAHPAVAWIGLISYGIFLWHYVAALELGSYGSDLPFWPLLAATLGFAIAAASLSYYLLERPILRLKH